MKKLMLITAILMNLITVSFAEDKTQAQDVVQIWLQEVFKMKSHDDYKTRDKIIEKLRPYSVDKDTNSINRKIAQFWAIKNRVEKRDKNSFYNKQTNFSYSFETKYIKYDQWRKRALVFFTIFAYQNFESPNNCNSIYLKKVGGKWKL